MCEMQTPFTWEKLETVPAPDPAHCQQGVHTWVVAFFESGRLAYWKCAGCGKTDCETDPLPERPTQLCE